MEKYLVFKGRKVYDGDGLYTKASVEFDHGSLPGISRCLKASMHDAGVVVYPRIRKFTPPECFLLMGVSQIDTEKIRKIHLSESQMFKLAGNSIVVDVLENIFRKLFIDKENENEQLSLF